MNSVWKPYCETQEQALDLSRPAVKVKEITALQALSAPTQPISIPAMYQGAYRQTVNPEVSFYSYPVTDQVQYVSLPRPLSNDSGHFTDKSANVNCDTESLSDDREYQIFEEDALRAMAAKNGGSLLGNNPKMRRAVQGSHSADDSYRKQRERNNIAAKASRDRRKLRELKLALQTAFLKKKVAELKASLATGLCRHCRQPCDC
ncbi:unnamed protein product [Spodoptera littoralis]|uniref:BZIP domain-containing protein n=1 Tax=Spodoptera littoralis TaxID=7109 RepID=A0A9P0I140_SPOLI|nr:unnamed protein product [Spodoptera littoralis]CAH1637107.1 unnamed protein product [Spodoptera littoralis]